MGQTAGRQRREADSTAIARQARRSPAASWQELPKGRDGLQHSQGGERPHTAYLEFTGTDAERYKPSADNKLVCTVQVWLTPDRVKQSPVGPALASLEPWLQIALFLLYVRRSRSPDWLPYVASLPEPQSPLSWSEEELDELAGTQLYTTLQGYRQDHLCCQP